MRDELVEVAQSMPDGKCAKSTCRARLADELSIAASIPPDKNLSAAYVPDSDN